MQYLPTCPGGITTAIAALILGLAVCAASQALPGDREQAASVKAQRSKTDIGKGITYLEGAVQVEQGSLLIMADEATIYRVDNRVNRVVAIGRPARFQYQPTPDEGLVTAEGSTIEYFVDSESVQLRKSASVEQEGRVITGHNIDYDLKNNAFEAVGDSATAETQRVHLFFPPSSQTGKVVD